MASPAGEAAAPSAANEELAAPAPAPAVQTMCLLEWVGPHTGALVWIEMLIQNPRSTHVRVDQIA